MSDAPALESPVRRRLLHTVLALTGIGSLGAALYPILRYLKPLPQSGPGGPVKLTADEVQRLDRNRFVITRAGSQRLLVLRDAQDHLDALSARCTHEGCTVTYVAAESVIWCACHNGRFAVDGRVISGPPPKPLPRFSAERTADGGVVVHLDRA